MTMPEETNMLIIEGTGESAVGITMLNLAVGGSNGISALQNLIKNDPSAAVILMIPDDMDDPDIIVKAVRAGAKAYIKKPASGKEVKRRLGNMLKRSEEK